MSDVDVCKCGHLAKAHTYKGCMRGWICDCKWFVSAYSPKYVAPVPRESKG